MMGQDPYAMMGQQMQPMMGQQMQPIMSPQMQPMMSPQMPLMMSPRMPQMMRGMEEGINKLPMPTVDLNKNNLLSDTAPPSLNTNINNLVGGSVLDFFLKKKI
jgi:hypothetical protein